MVEIRFITKEEVPSYRHALALGFGQDLEDEPDGDERFLAINNVDTTLAAFDRGHMVATFSGYDLEVTVPGGSIPTAGTTHVTVHPTHRRRGILTELMTMHLQQAIARNQPMAALWASEEQIYRRFGYGLACFGTDVAIQSRTLDLPLPAPDLSLRPLTEAEARAELPEIYEQALPATPGFFARSPGWWDHRHFRESDRVAQGASKRRFVLVERRDEAVGYVTYRQRSSRGIEEGRTQIVELIALDDDARRALWHFITNIDLYRQVEWWNAPIDEPLFREAERFRTIKRTEIDTMWLRPLDVPRLLETRRYERDGTVVLDVADSYLGCGGRFRLEVVAGEGRCEPTEDQAQVELDISDLGSVYLGGCSADALSRAGRITGEQEAVRTMTEVFHTRRPPYCIEVF